MELVNKEKVYKSNGNSRYSCQYHVVFCPKYRRRVLTDGIDSRLKELLVEGQEKYRYEILESEVMPDHVHLLLDVSPNERVHRVVGNLKGFLAHVLRNEFPSLKSRLPSLWSRSCFISSVGSVSLEVVKRYIENQKTA